MIGTKTQYYTLQDKLEKIHLENLQFLKWGEDFIKQTKLKKILPDQYDVLITQKAKIFSGGITKGNIRDICINFDNKIKNKPEIANLRENQKKNFVATYKEFNKKENMPLNEEQELLMTIFKSCENNIVSYPSILDIPTININDF